MVKDSAEGMRMLGHARVVSELIDFAERIIQVGKKKLVLDHLIVQKINDDDEASENVQSILTYGAQALFEESAEQAEARNVSCRHRLQSGRQHPTDELPDRL